MRGGRSRNKDPFYKISVSYIDQVIKLRLCDQSLNSESKSGLYLVSIFDRVRSSKMSISTKEHFSLGTTSFSRRLVKSNKSEVLMFISFMELYVL